MLIRQGAFTDGGRLLKGALHTHTTRSDGACTPEELLAAFEAKGYDFVALTDHRKYNREQFGSHLTVLPGMEIDVCFEGTRGNGRHVFHTVCLGPADGGDFRQDENFPSFDIRTPEAYQPMLDEMHRRGCLTIYCHPEWSHTPVHEYAGLKGNFAMELFNTGCAIENEMDTDNGVEWEYAIDSGNRMYGVAVDDCHCIEHVGHGFVRVNAANKAKAILDALAEGRFYASCGPEIRDFYVEDGEAVLVCDAADSIAFSCNGMPKHVTYAGEGEGLKTARMPLPHYAAYVRAVVIRNGKRAWTNPIWLKECR